MIVSNLFFVIHTSNISVCVYVSCSQICMRLWTRWHTDHVMYISRRLPRSASLIGFVHIPAIRIDRWRQGLSRYSIPIGVTTTMRCIRLLAVPICVCNLVRHLVAIRIVIKRRTTNVAHFIAVPRDHGTTSHSWTVRISHVIPILWYRSIDSTIIWRPSQIPIVILRSVYWLRWRATLL